MEKISGEILESFKGLPHIGDVGSRILYNEGFRSVQELAEADPEELAKMLETDRGKAAEMIQIALQMTRAKSLEEGGLATAPAVEEPSLDPVEQLEGVGEKLAEILKGHGFHTIQDVLKSDVEKLSDLQGIGLKRAEKLIQSAKHFLENRKK
jgi:ERCC4-type nuclease